MVVIPATSYDRGVLLTAEWRDLAMLNYEVDPHLLSDYVLVGTELDSFNRKTFVSLVGFRFLRTKIFGVLPLPFHANFDEINMRFYVRRRDGSGRVRRGVVFVREIVPKRAVAMIARFACGENYSRYPMRHRVSADGAAKSAEYEWRVRETWVKLRAEAAGGQRLPEDGSIEQFITEHYWGYSTQRDGGTVEYHVSHPQWRVWQSARAEFEGEGAEIYGSAIGEALQRPPDSAFIADGSAVVVFKAKRIA